MSICGMPSVMATHKGISAEIASRMAALVNGAGTKITLAFAPLCFIASATFLNTGTPRCSEPAFFGFTPPTTLVPYSIDFVVWNVP